MPSRNLMRQLIRLLDEDAVTLEGIQDYNDEVSRTHIGIDHVDRTAAHETVGQRERRLQILHTLSLIYGSPCPPLTVGFCSGPQHLWGSLEHNDSTQWELD